MRKLWLRERRGHWHLGSREVKTGAQVCLMLKPVPLGPHNAAFYILTSADSVFFPSPSPLLPDSSQHRAHQKPLPQEVSPDPRALGILGIPESSTRNPSPICLAACGLGCWRWSWRTGGALSSARAIGLRKGFVTWKHPTSFCFPPPHLPLLLTLLLSSWLMTSRRRMFNGVTYPPAERVHDGVQFPHFVLQGIYPGHLPTLGRCHKVPQLGQHTVIL